MDILPGQTVLDFGCGEGRYIQYFLDKGAIVTGTDIRQEGIVRARHKFTKIELHCGTLNGIDPSLKTYDLIWARDVFCAIPLSQKIPTLITLLKHLNPNGRLIFNEYGPQVWQTDILYKMIQMALFPLGMSQIINKRKGRAITGIFFEVLIYIPSLFYQLLYKVCVKTDYNYANIGFYSAGLGSAYHIQPKLMNIEIEGCLEAYIAHKLINHRQYFIITKRDPAISPVA